VVTFSWLLLLIAFAAAAGVTAGTADRAASTTGWAGVAVIAGLAVLLHLKLHSDVRRVKDEVRSLLER
jgi:hypothetical protein